MGPSELQNGLTGNGQSKMDLAGNGFYAATITTGAMTPGTIYPPNYEQIISVMPFNEEGFVNETSNVTHIRVNKVGKHTWSGTQYQTGMIVEYYHCNRLIDYHKRK